MSDIQVVAKKHNEKSIRRNWRQLCDPTLAFRAPCYQEVIALWQSKTGPLSLPKRSGISARELKPFLSNIVVVERIAENPSQYRWKLMGTKVTQALGEHTGKLFDESLAPEHSTRLSESYDMVLGDTKPWRFYGEVTLNGRDYLVAENLYLPLADDNGLPRFIMGLCRYTSAQMEGDDLRECIENAMLSQPRGLL
jgi:hypothetical protein